LSLQLGVSPEQIAQACGELLGRHAIEADILNNTAFYHALKLRDLPVANALSPATPSTSPASVGSNAPSISLFDRQSPACSGGGRKALGPSFDEVFDRGLRELERKRREDAALFARFEALEGVR